VPHKMIHRVTINLLAAESAKEVFFSLSSLFEISYFRNENNRLFLLSSFKDHIGCIFMMNIILDTSSNSAIAKAIESINVGHFGYTITDMTNDHVTFGKPNIKREIAQDSPYRESAQNIVK